MLAITFAIEMTLKTKTVTVSGKEYVQLTKGQYNRLMRYMEDMEDRLAIKSMEKEPTISAVEFWKEVA